MDELYNRLGVFKNKHMEPWVYESRMKGCRFENSPEIGVGGRRLLGKLGQVIEDRATGYLPLEQVEFV